MFKKGKLFDVPVPGIGKVDVSNPMAWFAGALGMAFLMLTAGLGNNLAKWINNKVTAVDASYRVPIQGQTQVQVVEPGDTIV